MTTETQAIAAIRFGTGLGADQPPDGPGALIAQFSRRDPALAEQAPDLAARATMLVEHDAARALRKEQTQAGERAVKAADRKLRRTTTWDMRMHFARAVGSPLGFRERLAAFWTDHFTVEATGRMRTLLVPDLIRTAIRPHVGGRFGDMLADTVRHPAMLHYLNQNRSVGPNSRAGQRRGLGLNENLAREVLELHTLGVEGDYIQADVLGLAQLFTGMTLRERGFHFAPNWAEPGAETVLGRSYGGAEPAAWPEIRAALDDLAVHPDTARHLATKLIVHFVGAPAAPDYVAKIARAYLNAGGRLVPAYRALLEDDRAWNPTLAKAKTPFDFIVSGLRALKVDAGLLSRAKRRDLNGQILGPMAAMGQPLMRPAGPDGWPEDPRAWITPAGLAARVDWAGRSARRWGAETDPREFLQAALGPLAPPLLSRAAGGSETRAEGVALVLAAPAFNRR